MHCKVATLVLRSPVFTALSKLVMRSPHCPCGSSMAAMAATTCAATAPTREVGELSALRASVLTLTLYSSGTFSHLVVTSLRRASSCYSAGLLYERSHRQNEATYSRCKCVFQGNTSRIPDVRLRVLVHQLGREESDVCGLQEE